MNTRSQKGFTLVEIMIVVVIIGLLAAMAIPAFQKVRASSQEKALLNDGRQIGAAIQQYCMEYGLDKTGSVSYDKATGLLSHTGGFTAYLRSIAPGYTMSATDFDANADACFTIAKAGAFNSKAVTFNGEGKKTAVAN